MVTPAIAADGEWILPGGNRVQPLTVHHRPRHRPADVDERRFAGDGHRLCSWPSDSSALIVAANDVGRLIISLHRPEAGERAGRVDAGPQVLILEAAALSVTAVRAFDQRGLAASTLTPAGRHLNCRGRRRQSSFARARMHGRDRQERREEQNPTCEPASIMRASINGGEL